MASDAVISVELNALDECTENLSQISRAVENIKDTVERLNNGMNEYWDGEAHEAYKSKNAQIVNYLVTLQNQISENQQKLSTAIETYKTTEGIVSDTVNDLSTDNIF